MTESEHLYNLLARVFRDGGHHTGAVGLEAAVAEADARVARLNAMEDALRGLVQYGGPIIDRQPCCLIESQANDQDPEFLRLAREFLGNARGLLGPGTVREAYDIFYEQYGGVMVTRYTVRAVSLADAMQQAHEHYKALYHRDVPEDVHIVVQRAAHRADRSDP